MDYLKLDDALHIHAEQLRLFGGAKGVRDHGLIESALLRPQTGFYADLIGQAAALWESLAMIHGFIDGNKRVAFAATYTFLYVNGARIDADADAIWRFISDMYETQTFTYDRLTGWLRENVRMIED